MIQSFSNLSLPKPCLENLQSLGYETMTPIQAISLPAILQGQDVIAQAKTGSGKTAAFGIGLLLKLYAPSLRVQALVLCPTRELADQVSKEMRRLARYVPNVKVQTICGGTPARAQVTSLLHGAHIIVGTPGRVQDHLDRGTLELDALKTLVLDEADRMLDMGFGEAIRKIIQAAPPRRQTLLFSATYPETIHELSRTIQKSPVDVRAESAHDHADIEQVFYQVDKDKRMEVLVSLLAQHKPESALVFCNTKQQCHDVAVELKKRGLNAAAIHGDLEQRERDQVLALFSNKSTSVLVATDVAARGLDIKDLQAVINFELTPDPEIHVHRIGRTGRAGKKGLALSLFSSSELGRLRKIEEYQQSPAVQVLGETLPKVERLDYQPTMVTLRIHGGRKDKLRPTDILGALTGDAGVLGEHVGKITIADAYTLVAIHQSVARDAFERLSGQKIKGRRFMISKIA